MLTKKKEKLIKDILNMIKEGELSGEKAEILLEALNAKSLESELEDLEEELEFDEDFTETLQDDEREEKESPDLGEMTEEKGKLSLEGVMNVEIYLSKDVCLNVSEKESKENILLIGGGAEKFLNTSKEGETLRLMIDRKRASREGRLKLQILSPKAPAVEIKGNSGKISASDFLGDLSVTSNSGDLTLIGSKYGAVTVRTKDGDVTIEDVDQSSEIDVKTISGDVEIRDTAAPMKLKTVSGDVEIEDAEGEIRISTASGDVEISDAEGKTEITTASGSVEINDMKGSIEIKDASGDVEIKDVSGEIYVKTSSGDIECKDLALSGGKFQTSSGSVELTLNRLMDNCIADVKVNSGGVSLTIPEEGHGILTAKTGWGWINNQTGITPLENLQGKMLKLKLSDKDTGDIPQIKIKTNSGEISLNRN